MVHGDEASIFHSLESDTLEFVVDLNVFMPLIFFTTTHQMKFSISPQEFRQEYLSNPYHKHKILEMKIFVLMHYSSFVSRIY